MMMIWKGLQNLYGEWTGQECRSKGERKNTG